MFIVERAKSDRSVCFRCGKAIEGNYPRLRIKITKKWGFCFCYGCVEKMVGDWRTFIREQGFVI